jgi:hypothetical protein
MPAPLLFDISQPGLAPLRPACIFSDKTVDFYRGRQLLHGCAAGAVALMIVKTNGTIAISAVIAITTSNAACCHDDA